MQNAVDIMAMVQKTSVPKQKFDVPSKTFGNEKASFKRELLDAKRTVQQNDKFNTKAASQSQRTTENKAEKFAKVMSSNGSKAEVKEKTTVEAMEQTNAAETKDNQVKVETTDKVVKPEEVSTEEATKSLMEMLQQLMQMLENLNKAGATDQNTEALKAELEGAIQKLQMVMTMPIAVQTEDLSNQMKTLKNNFAVFVKQLEATPGPQTDTKQVEALIKDFAKKLDEVEAQLHTVLKQTDKPNGKAMILDQLLKENKLSTNAVNEKSTATEVQQTEGTQQINMSSEEKSAEGKEQKENSKDQNQGDTLNKADTSRETKQVLTTDKPMQGEFNEAIAVQNEKVNFQLNVKNVNNSLAKENLVKINSTDVINQVVKKADIIIQGGHQEMIMKLEPESLGKLNLKLVIENGLVTAKFVAESQQVKEVLESSFNQLKDALQEKGIAVQGFSVSVGQQGAEFNSGQTFDQWKKSIKLSSKITGDYLELDEESSMSANPYSYHEGKVDYRA